MYASLAVILSVHVPRSPKLWITFSKTAPTIRYWEAITGLVKLLNRLSSIVPYYKYKELHQKKKNSPIYLRDRTADIDENAYEEVDFL